MSVKVFRLNDCEWWAAETLPQAIAACRAQVGVEYQDELIDDPRELTEEDLDRLKFNRDDGTQCTFREELNAQIANMGNESFPHLFASTEY